MKYFVFLLLWFGSTCYSDSDFSQCFDPRVHFISKLNCSLFNEPETINLYSENLEPKSKNKIRSIQVLAEVLDYGIRGWTINFRSSELLDIPFSHLLERIVISDHTFQKCVRPTNSENQMITRFSRTMIYYGKTRKLAFISTAKSQYLNLGFPVIICEAPDQRASVDFLTQRRTTGDKKRKNLAVSGSTSSSDIQFLPTETVIPKEDPTDWTFHNTFPNPAAAPKKARRSARAIGKWTVVNPKSLK